MKIEPAVTNSQPQLFVENSPWFRVFLILMFSLAALIRRDEIRAPGFAPTREYTSAIIARAFYYAGNDNIVPWRQNIASMLKDQQPILEPPLTEYLVSLSYRILGNEEISYARYFTGIFWLIGGVFVYKISRILLSADAALFATAYYLFVPMGVIVSRSFQPEALMMMMYLISLYYIIVYYETLTKKHLFLAAILTGVAVFIRPLVIFALFAAFIAIAIHRKGSVSRVVDNSFIIFFAISMVIPFIYYGYGILIADYMRWKVAHSFRPHLFVHWDYWKGWLDSGIDVAGHLGIIFALLGFLFLRKSIARTLVISLAIGYFIFGLVFNYHIMTHSYYHIQIFPLLGICASAFLVHIASNLKNALDRYSWVAVVFVLLFGLDFSYKEVRESLSRPVFEPPNVAREIGEIIKHNPYVVTDAYEYGLPLAFYGEFSGTWWPEKIEEPLYRHPSAKEFSVQERLDSFGFQPEYFVITNFGRFNKFHKDLKAYLEENCMVLAQTDSYWIFSNCQTTKAQ
jgi:4-amino-4-deoxy-L-arabinose transferase-like glycosyltransferase